MANPVVIPIIKNEWSKVATAARVGAVIPLKQGATYLQTIRVTGDPAPTNGDFSDAKEFAFSGAVISNSFDIDVYISTVGGDGEVRVDLP